MFLSNDCYFISINSIKLAKEQLHGKSIILSDTTKQLDWILIGLYDKLAIDN